MLGSRGSSNLSVDHELMLEWVSELGSGTWDQFRRVNDWLLNSNLSGRERRPSSTAIMLTTLGHIEIDWSSNKWSAAPPVLTVIPSAGAHAILIGCRTRHLKQRLQQYAAENQDFYLAPCAQLEAPDAIFIGTSDEKHVRELAAHVGVQYEFSVSDRLSDLLPEFGSYLSLARHSVPTRGFGVERFDAASLQWKEVGADSLPGLYKYKAYGRPEFRFVDSASAFLALDRPIGIYAELRRTERSVLRFEEDALNGTLVVPVAAPLPWMQARCAALCSGLEPWLERRDWTRRYVNVPAEIAARIARSLDQELTVKVLPRDSSRFVQQRAQREIQHIRFSD